LIARLPEFAARGADVVLVGQGEPADAAAFRALSGWRGPILVDGPGDAWRAVALRRTSLLGLLRPRLLREALAATREGHRQTAVQGDAWRLGGTLVVAPGDRVLFAYRNTGPEDEAPIDEVLAALPAARG
jgi:hypothetical protein